MIVEFRKIKIAKFRLEKMRALFNRPPIIGTVEDYSEHGNAWNFTIYDMALSKAYRWDEEGVAGISDNQDLLLLE